MQCLIYQNKPTSYAGLGLAFVISPGGWPTVTITHSQNWMWFTGLMHINRNMYAIMKIIVYTHVQTMLYTYMCMAAVCRLATGILKALCHAIHVSIIITHTYLGGRGGQCSLEYNYMPAVYIVLGLTMIHHMKFYE